MAQRINAKYCPLFVYGELTPPDIYNKDHQLPDYLDWYYLCEGSAIDRKPTIYSDGEPIMFDIPRQDIEIMGDKFVKRVPDLVKGSVYLILKYDLDHILPSDMPEIFHLSSQRVVIEKDLSRYNEGGKGGYLLNCYMFSCNLNSIFYNVISEYDSLDRVKFMQDYRAEQAIGDILKD